MLLTSNNKGKIGVKPMILNTLSKDHASRYLPVLYTPLDPKYVYQYQSSSTLTGDNTYLPVESSSGGMGAGLDDLMNQRNEVIQSKIQLLVSEIDKRYFLKNENLSGICQDQCSCRNLIYLMGDMYMDRRRIELERKIIDLEQEKRGEKSAYFRDILFIKKELRESLIEKLEENQKTSMFMNEKEAFPWNP